MNIMLLRSYKKLFFLAISPFILNSGLIYCVLFEKLTANILIGIKIIMRLKNEVSFHEHVIFLHFSIVMLFSDFYNFAVFIRTASNL